MEITDIRIRKMNDSGKMRAVVSVTFDNEFVVHDIKIIESQKGLFAAMPSRRSSDGGYMDVAHPINQEIREKINGAIIAKYKEACEKVLENQS